MQEIHSHNEAAWPTDFHLSLDSFDLVRNVADIIQSIQGITLALSSSSSLIGDLLPLMASALDSTFPMEVKSTTRELKDAVGDSTSTRF